MAERSKTYCAHYPCKNLVEVGQSYCQDHKPAKPKDDYRSDKFYHSRLWTKCSRWYRADHPLCESCLEAGIIKPTDLVDHIRPIKDGGDKLNPKNMQSLCHACHNRKSKQERTGRGPVVYGYG